MSEMKILITGMAGFIGFHLTKLLASENHELVGIDNLNDYYDPALKEARLAELGFDRPNGEMQVSRLHPSIRFQKCGLEDAAALNALFAQERFDVVVNLAAQAGVRYSIDHPRSYIESNVIGFFNILEACRAYPVKHLVYASSSSVYGNQQKVPFSTDDVVNRPISLYAATKLSDELMAYTYSHLYGIPSTGLRFFTVYGPFGRPDMAYFSFTRKILAGESIKVFNQGDLYRDFTYVDDIVRGVKAVMMRAPEANDAGDRYMIYNIGNNQPVKLMEFIGTLEKQLGQEAKKEYLPMQPGDVYQTYADDAALERDFGFKPSTPLSEGLARFAEWYFGYYGQMKKD
ncbi:MAG: NAD-dependent epimerase/dehydratase family protein [Eubacteriales bacterium]|nr:NAD-dependent epimerase/dehydratase family protein [Eubacteriales bacterium]